MSKETYQKLTNIKGFSRRDVLQVGAGVGGAVLGYSLLRYDEILSDFFEPEFEASVTKAKEFIREEYGIDIVTGLPVNAQAAGITGEEPNEYELKRGTRVAAQELLKYPSWFPRDNGVKAIRFLSNVRIHGKKLAGFVSEYSEGILTLAYSAGLPDVLATPYRSAFHHEMFHLLDNYNGGFEQSDKKWKSLIMGETHGSTSSERSKFSRALLLGQIDSYINNDAFWSASEERALFAQIMMMPKTHKLFLRKIENENDKVTKNILLRKYAMIKQYYSDWSNGVLNEKFWADINGNRVVRGYFN